MSDSILTVLKFCLLALLYLFLMRVILTVARELRGSASMSAPPPLPAPAAQAAARGSKRREWKLVVVTPETERGRAFAIDGDATIGRGGGCTVSLAFDTFASQDARQAHIQGEIAKALMAKKDELLAADPEILPADVLAQK